MALGARWQLLTASAQAVDPLGALATLAALLTAGRYAERRLGSGLFGASFAVAGATSAVAWYGLSAVPLLVSLGQQETLFAGASGGLLGPAGALLAFTAGNWRALEGRQRGQCAAAALGLAAPTLVELGLGFTGTPLDQAFSLPIHGLSLLVGALVGAAAGPQLQVQQEVSLLLVEGRWGHWPQKSGVAADEAEPALEMKGSEWGFARCRPASLSSALVLPWPPLPLHRSWTFKRGR